MLQVRSIPEGGRLSPPPQAGASPIPPTERRFAPRPRLVARLETAIRASRVVVVDAAAGAGKTALIASWAGGAGPRTVVSWRTVVDGERLVDLIDRLVVDEPGLLPDDGRLRAIGPADLTGDRHVVVLDGFPAGPDRAVHSAIGRFLERTGAHVVLLLVCTGSPRLDFQGLGLTADAIAVDPDELALNRAEVGAVLARHAVTADADLTEKVWRVTGGWAWGVRLAASRLARSDASAPMLREVEQAIADYLENSVLRDVRGAERELLVATSMVEHVPGDLAYEIAGGAALLPTVDGRSRGFVRRHGDGSITLHQLLRRHLLHGLRRDDAALVAATRRVTDFLVEQHDRAMAVTVALEAGDWAWAADALVEDLRVPRLLTGATDPLLEQTDLLAALGAAEPVLLTAAALAHSWPEVAAQAPQPVSPGPGVAAELSASLVQMCLARWDGDHGSGLSSNRQAAAQVARLSLTQRASHPELAPLLLSHLACFELGSGSTDRAREALERGARSFRSRTGTRFDSAAQAAAADCLGQLAWLEALGGELTAAQRHAHEVLSGPTAQSTRVGSAYARLAGVWCLLSRGEADAAATAFEALAQGDRPADEAVLPDLAAATALMAARLAAHGAALPGRSPALHGPQGEHQLRLIRAEAELDAGAAGAALALLAESTQRSADLHVLRARAWIQLGDLASVAASLRVRPVETLTLQTSVQLELIESWLARAHHDRARERLLADRALRLAGRELLRAPIAWAKPWLYELILSEPDLLRRHGPFLASVRGTASEPVTPAVAGSSAAPSSPLTDRELDILQRLGALSTNEEIAAELYLSPNTIKTHLKSLYRKLDVTRRSDAFRRGRALGLC